MSQPDLRSAEATAAWFIETFGGSALLQACVCGHEALADNDLDRCRFWQQVIAHLEGRDLIEEDRPIPPD